MPSHLDSRCSVDSISEAHHTHIISILIEIRCTRWMQTWQTYLFVHHSTTTMTTTWMDLLTCLLIGWRYVIKIMNIRASWEANEGIALKWVSFYFLIVAFTPNQSPNFRLWARIAHRRFIQSKILIR